MLDEFIDGMTEELFDIKPCQDALAADKLAIIQSWAKEKLSLDRPITTMGHKLSLHVRRPPKFQHLLNILRETSEAHQDSKPSNGLEEMGENQADATADNKFLILCHQGRAEEMAFLIYSYFNAGRTVSSVLDMQSLLWFLVSEERSADRNKGLKSNSQATFEKCLLEQRLVDEIIKLLESGHGFLQAQINSSELSKEDYKEMFGTEEDSIAMADLQTLHMLTNEHAIYEDLQIVQSQLASRIPQLLAKLVVIPEKVAIESLKMVKAANFDEKGHLKTNEFVAPGVQVKVMEYSQLSKDLSILQDYKPNKVIMYDHNNYYIRHFQFSQLLDHQMDVSILVGESYLEGWLYKIRNKREDETFVKLTKNMAHLHGFKTRAEDRIKFDSALKELDKGKKELQVTRINPDGPAVLIDKREFNSATPGLLYFNGYKVLPMFLKSGDYILSNDMAIERKAFEDFKQSLTGGRLDSQLNQMKATFSRIYVLVEIHEGHSVEELNNWLSNRRVSEQISIYRNARMSNRYVLNLGGVVQLYKERHPRATFLFSFRPQDTIAYFKYLKQLAGDLNIEKFGEYSRGFEAKSKKVDEYFQNPNAQPKESTDDQPKASRSNSKEAS